VKGRLLVVVVGAVEADGPSNGSRLLVGAALELDEAAMTGVTEQLTPLIDPQLAAAPDTVGATSKEVTANPEPMINRLAHIMVALLPVGTTSLRFPSQTTTRS
jgi:hypothetical protein